MSKKTILITTVLIIAGFSAYFVHSSLSATKSATWPTSKQVARTYIHFSQPHGKSSISATKAEAIASRFMGVNALGARLRYCIDRSMSPNVQQDCWEVLMNPAKLHMPSSALHKKVQAVGWAIDLVDAKTGKGIEWAQAIH